MIHLDTVVTILSSINLGIGGWLIYRFENILGKFLSAIDDTRTDIASEARNTRTNLAGHIAQRSAEIIDQTAQTTSAAATETHSRIDALSTHLSTHADDLATQTESLKAHARDVIDRAHQNTERTERAKCPQCQRIVYKFQRRADGTIFRCLDCQAKG
jgi:DNA anti-recombination protein RmuC